jgi:hypothetical protein
MSRDDVLDFDPGIRDVDDARMDVPGVLSGAPPAIDEELGIALDDNEGDEMGIEKFSSTAVPLTTTDDDVIGAD